MTTNYYDCYIEIADACQARVAQVVANVVEHLAENKQPKVALRLKWVWQSRTGQESQGLSAQWWAESTAPAIVMTKIQMAERDK